MPIGNNNIISNKPTGAELFLIPRNISRTQLPPKSIEPRLRINTAAICCLTNGYPKSTARGSLEHQTQKTQTTATVALNGALNERCDNGIPWLGDTVPPHLLIETKSQAVDSMFLARWSRWMKLKIRSCQGSITYSARE